MTINGTIDVDQKQMAPLMHIALRHVLIEQTTQHEIAVTIVALIAATTFDLEKIYQLPPSSRNVFQFPAKSVYFPTTPVALRSCLHHPFHTSFSSCKLLLLPVFLLVFFIKHNNRKEMDNSLL